MPDNRHKIEKMVRKQARLSLWTDAFLDAPIERGIDRLFEESDLPLYPSFRPEMTRAAIIIDENYAASKNIHPDLWRQSRAMVLGMQMAKICGVYETVFGD